MMFLQDTVRSLVRGGKVEGRKGDGSCYYRCPFCKGRKKLEVDVRRPVWYCHKCGIGGVLDEEPRAFVGEYGIISRIPCFDPTIPSPLSFFKPATIQEPSASALRTYLLWNRRLSWSAIHTLRPHCGPSPVRVYFPFYELGGTKPIYFVGRSILPCFPRYWNPSLEDFAPHRKNTVLWGLHRFQKLLPQVVICEGIFSACYEPNRVAVLGKTISSEQVNIIKQICMEEVIVCLDGGERAASAIMANKLSRETTLDVSVVHLPNGKDPDDLRNITPWFKLRERIA